MQFHTPSHSIPPPDSLLLDERNRAIVIAESLARVIAAIRIASVLWRSYLPPKHRIIGKPQTGSFVTGSFRQALATRSSSARQTFVSIVFVFAIARQTLAKRLSKTTRLESTCLGFPEISPHRPCVRCAAIRIVRLAFVRLTFVPRGIAEGLARVDRVR